MRRLREGRVQVPLRGGTSLVAYIPSTAIRIRPFTSIYPFTGLRIQRHLPVLRVFLSGFSIVFFFTAHETELRPAVRVGEHGRFALVRPARGVLQLPPPYPAKVREHHLRREAEQVQLERLRRVSFF